MSEEFLASDANLLALSDLHRALSAAYEAAFPGQVADTPRAAIGALVLEVGRLREEYEFWRLEAQDTLTDLREKERELAQAWEQSGSDRADLSAALVELEAARAALDALRGVLWMAEKWAEGGGRAGPEMRDYKEALAALAAYDAAVKAREP